MDPTGRYVGVFDRVNNLRAGWVHLGNEFTDIEHIDLESSFIWEDGVETESEKKMNNRIKEIKRLRKLLENELMKPIE